MKKNKLFIYLGFNYFGFWLFSSEKIINFQKTQLNQNFTEIFFSNLKIFMKKNNLIFDEIEEVYSTSGPGSYLSNCILAVILRTLSLVFPIKKFFQINILEWISKANKQTIALVQANKKNFYWSIYQEKKPMKIKTVSFLDLEKLKLKYQKFNFNFEDENSDFEKIFFLLQKKFKPFNWKNFKLKKV